MRNAESEQITSDLELVYEHDVRLKRSEIRDIFISVFGQRYSEEKILGKKVDVVKYNNKNYILLTCQITYLGNPHPTFKKRVQLKSWFKDVYDLLSCDSNNDIRLIGIYRFKEQVVFVDFEKEPYFSRKMHNSSAHIYTNDLYQALIRGAFFKIDAKNNFITCVSKDYFRDYILHGRTDSVRPEQEIVEAVHQFNVEENIFTNWIESDVAIRTMRDNSFSKWKEGEWAGFFLEYLFDRYIQDNKIEDILKYLNNKSDDNRMLDFDLFFKKGNFYGDLKSSDIEKRETILNDKRNILFELENYGKLWYLIYEHETVKDNDIEGHPYTRKRLGLIREVEPDYKSDNDESYLQRLKGKVKYTRMFIVEVNKINYESLLEEMTSNFHNSNGNTREPKLKLTKDNVKNAIIYTFSL